MKNKGKNLGYSVALLVVIIVFLLLTISSSIENNTKPVILRIEPESGYIGDTISIYGKFFNNKKEGSDIYFGEINCKEYDFDFVYWSDELIKVKVPSGTKSGFIKAQINDTTVIGPQFHLINENSFKYSMPFDLTVDYTLKICSINESCNLPLYIWVPSPVPSDSQREVRLINASDNHLERQKYELDLYKIDSLSKGKEYLVSKKFHFTNYQVETNIDPKTITDDYDVASEFYKYYTAPQYGIESDNPRIIKLAKAIVNEEKNPYYKARMIYDWVVNNMDYQYPPPGSVWRAIAALNTHRGDCAVYSFLFCALCNAVGIPARAVTGHVLFINNVISMHFWAEFYLPKYGWIPIDANYGDIQVNGFMPREFYFGNLDNRHIAFSKGMVECDMPDDYKGEPKVMMLRYLQKYHSYMEPKARAISYQVQRFLTRVF